MRRIFKCGNCNRHTMREICVCGSKALLSSPLKYSPDDKFSSYRRKAKIQEYLSKGFL